MKIVNDIIRNKNICLVGNATSLNNSKFGEQIDSYDVVCRINDGSYVPEHLHESRGKRIDIAFINLFFSFFTGYGQNSYKYLLKANIPLVMAAIDRRVPSDKVMKSKLSKEFHHNINYLPEDNFTDLRAQIGSIPSCGLLSINYIANYFKEIKSLHIFGFDFKASGTFYHSKARDEAVNLANYHKYDKEKKFVKNLLANNIKVKLY